MGFTSWAGGFVGGRRAARRGRAATSSFEFSVPAEWFREHYRRNQDDWSGDPQDWLDDLQEQFGSELNQWSEPVILAGIVQIMEEEEGGW